MTPGEYLHQLERVTTRLIRRLTTDPISSLLSRGSSSPQRAPGSPPGTLRLPDDAAPTVIHAVRYNADRVETLPATKVGDLAALRLDEDRLWVDIIGSGDGRWLKAVGKDFGVHPLALADLVNVPQRPKAESYGDRHLIITHVPHISAESGEPGLIQIGVILGPGFLLTFRERDTGGFDSLLQRLHAEPGRMRGEMTDYLAYALLDLATDMYFPVVEALGEQIDELEDAVFAARDEDLLSRLHSQRRALLTLGRVLWRQRDMLSHLLRETDETFRPEIKVYLRDVHDHAIQLTDVIETSQDLVTSLVEIHLTHVSNRMNKVMQTLTIIASIFIPLTFIAGLYGMNFEYMPELGWPWAYPAVLGIMVVTAGILLWWFRRRGWLGRGSQPPER